MLAKKLFDRFEFPDFDLTFFDYNSPMYLFFTPSGLHENSWSSTTLDEWKLGCYALRPIDVAACMHYVTTERFVYLLGKADLRTLTTKSDEGLLYWLCFDSNKLQRQAKMQALLKKGPATLEHGITHLHILAAMGGPRGTQSIGTADINGLYPYHYAIAACSENFLDWLPAKEELKTIDSGYYQGVSFFWWLAYHFSQFFMRCINNKPNPSFPDITTINFNDRPLAEKNPERNNSLVSFLGFGFFELVHTQPKLLQQIHMNGIFTEVNNTTVMNGLIGEKASRKFCAWLIKHAPQCTTHIDVCGVIDKKKSDEADESYLFEKLAKAGEYEGITALLKDPRYPIEDLIALHDFVQKEKAIANGDDFDPLGVEIEINYDKITADIQSAISAKFEKLTASLPFNIEDQKTKQSLDELKKFLHSVIALISLIPETFSCFKKAQTELSKILYKLSVNEKIALYIVEQLQKHHKLPTLYSLPIRSQVKCFIMLHLAKGDEEGQEILMGLLTESLSAEAELAKLKQQSRTRKESTSLAEKLVEQGFHKMPRGEDDKNVHNRANLPNQGNSN